MQLTRGLIAIGLLALARVALANPFPDERRVPHVAPDFFATEASLPPALSVAETFALARDVLRVRLDWNESSDAFTLARAVIEPSGTDATLARAAREDALGSYKARLVDPATGAAIAHDSIGTGQEFRKLTRALSFRFPVPDRPVDIELTAENPETGVMETVLTARLDPATLSHATPPAAEVRTLRAATASPALMVNVYAEGYPAGANARFFQDAARVARAFESYRVPGQERFEIRGVFAPSAKGLGAARDLGMPVPERDSFLGLYFPYWRNFGRWYDVVYPTREERFRAALASAPYDYAIALVDDAEYWGVGNYRELTAIPARHASFAYLLAHEFGHFLGLNEEYEEGGPTELAFAPAIHEPWSQNITFLRDPAALKWRELVSAGTPLPTPPSRWRSSQAGPYGAYEGGYAETEPLGLSHKPGLSCTMKSDSAFCPICRRALEERVRFDVGL